MARIAASIYQRWKTTLPIYLEWLEQPSDQDCLDLEKLYGDSPESWQPASGLKWALEQVSEGKKIALGRFNDRIVCAAHLHPSEQSEGASFAYQLQIEKLCVRTITRERGVAKQLLVRLCQWANGEEAGLYIEDNEGRLSGLYELGFVQYLQGWRYLPR